MQTKLSESRLPQKRRLLLHMQAEAALLQNYYKCLECARCISGTASMRFYNYLANTGHLTIGFILCICYLTCPSPQEFKGANQWPKVEEPPSRHCPDLLGFSMLDTSTGFLPCPNTYSCFGNISNQYWCIFKNI